MELTALPPVIEELDVIQGNLLGQPVKHEVARGAAETKGIALGLEAASGEEIDLVGGGATTLLGPAREDQESREVENLL